MQGSIAVLVLCAGAHSARADDWLPIGPSHPDGSIINFSGTVYEKPIIQARGVKLLAKTFTLPGVQVGSIVEYRYKHDFASGYVFNSHWILSDPQCAGR